jgi:hypothetical protein
MCGGTKFLSWANAATNIATPVSIKLFSEATQTRATQARSEQGYVARRVGLVNTSQGQITAPLGKKKCDEFTLGTYGMRPISL